MKAMLLLSTMLLALAAAARAEVPPVMDHQGYLTTAGGAPVTGTRTMVFTIYDAAEAGQALWTETQSVTVTDGLFNVYLGDVAALPATIFTGQALYLGVRVGTDSEMTPRIRLAAVPYAFASGRDALPAQRWFRDADGDLFGNPYVWVPSVGQPVGYVADSTDCNDGDAAIHPGAEETCDGVDSNCDLADGNPEVCDGQDNDCSGTADDNMVGPLCPLQEGACGGARMICGGVSGWLPCTAANYGSNYEPTEATCDGLDNDCDGVTDESLTGPPCPLQDGVCAGAQMTCGGASGWLPCGTAEYGPHYQPVEDRCDGLDNDCDGMTDEEADCDDGIPCTTDECGDFGCQHALALGYCLIAGTCYADGEANPANECQVCDSARSQTLWSPREDGTPCTGGTCQGGTCTPP